MAPLRVGMDVSSLALTRAGTARHIESLLKALEHEPEVELRLLLQRLKQRADVPCCACPRERERRDIDADAHWPQFVKALS